MTQCPIPAPGDLDPDPGDRHPGFLFSSFQCSSGSVAAAAARSHSSSSLGLGLRSSSSMAGKGGLGRGGDLPGRSRQGPSRDRTLPNPGGAPPSMPRGSQSSVKDTNKATGDSASAPPSKAAGDNASDASNNVSEWNTATTSKQRKSEERFARYQKERAERVAAFPKLYEAGYTDAEVKAMAAGLASAATTGNPPRNSTAPNPSASRGGRGGQQHGGPQRGGRGGRGGTGGGSNRSEVQGSRASGSGTSSGSSTNKPGSKKRGRDVDDHSNITPPAKSVTFARTSILSREGPEPLSYVAAAKARLPATPSTASVAKRRRVAEAPNFPHMLHVHTGRKEREPLTAENWAAIEVELRKRVLSYAKEPDHIMLSTAFIRKVKDSGLIACKNEATAQWFVTQVDNIDVNGVVFKAWPTIDVGLKEARIHVHGMGLEPKEVIELIKAFNPMEGEIVLLRKEEFREKDFLILGLDDVAAGAMALLPEPWVVQLGLDQKRIQYGGKWALLKRLRARNEPRATLAANAIETVLNANKAKAPTSEPGETSNDEVDALLAPDEDEEETPMDEERPGDALFDEDK